MKFIYGIGAAFLIIIITFLNQTQAQTQQLTIGHSFVLHSNVLDEDRTIMVSLPLNYQNSQSKYPVLYLLDAEGNFNFTAGVMQFLASTIQMPEMILIGIRNTNRNRDFTPAKVEGNPNTGGADNFLDFLEKELMPYVDKNYSTVPYKILVGHSLCGMFSFYAFFTRPQLFNSSVAISPWLIHNNHYIMDFSKEHLGKITSLNKAVYFTAGSLERAELLNTMDEFTGLLKNSAPKDFHWEYNLMQNEDHETQVLAAIYDGLKFIYEGWTFPQDRLTEGLDPIENHFKSLSAKYGYEISPPEILLNGAGYVFLQKHLIDEAITIFKRNVELYPKSPNVYDSLGEAYENKNDLENAKRNYYLGYTLGVAVNHPYTKIFKTNLDRVLEKLNRN